MDKSTIIVLIGLLLFNSYNALSSNSTPFVAGMGAILVVVCSILLIRGLILNHRKVYK